MVHVDSNTTSYQPTNYKHTDFTLKFQHPPTGNCFLNLSTSSDTESNSSSWVRSPCAPPPNLVFSSTTPSRRESAVLPQKICAAFLPGVGRSSPPRAKRDPRSAHTCRAIRSVRFRSVSGPFLRSVDGILDVRFGPVDGVIMLTVAMRKAGHEDEAGHVEGFVVIKKSTHALVVMSLTV